MDRTIVNKGQIPLETDILNTNKFAMIGLAKFAAAVLGASTYINGLNCSPATGLNVSISAGEIYSLQNVDGTAYSSLAADTVHQILKQGISLDSVSLSCPAPAASGTSINYLIQATYQDVDSNPVVLQYYNPVNPTLPFSGKNNDGVSQSTVRKGACIVSVKAGVAATTGSQVTPSVDAGYVGLYVVSVPYGLSAITLTNISILSGAPFLTETLPQKISKATADTLYVSSAQVQALIEQYAGQSVTLSGSNNAFTGALTPAISSNSALGEPVVVKFPSAITGAATINLGGGVTALVDAQGNAFGSTNTVPAGNSIVQYDPAISKYRVLGIGGIDQVARNAAAAAVIPPGVVHEYEGIVAPAGYLMCDGSAVSRTAYSALFAVIGTKFGAGDGSATFNVPDRRDRMPIGAGAIAAVGDKGGSKDAVVVLHTHDAIVIDNGHGHATLFNRTSKSNNATPYMLSDPNYGENQNGSVNLPSSASTTGISVSNSNAGVSGANANLPPYIGTNFIIKT